MINDVELKYKDFFKHFTIREFEIFKLYIGGKEKKEIACQLNISYETVRSHIKNIYAKTSTNSRSRLIYWCLNL